MVLFIVNAEHFHMFFKPTLVPEIIFIYELFSCIPLVVICW